MRSRSGLSSISLPGRHGREVISLAKESGSSGMGNG